MSTSVASGHTPSDHGLHRAGVVVAGAEIREQRDDRAHRVSGRLPLTGWRQHTSTDRQ